MAQAPKRVTHQALVLCEGKDEVNLLEAMAGHLGVDVQCIECGGNEQFRSLFSAVVKVPGFGDVTSLGIVRDAETSAADAATSVKSRLKAEHLAVPNGPLEMASASYSPDTVFLIVPNGSGTGMLEDLVLRVLFDDPSWPCQDAYFECLNKKGISPDKDFQKRRVQAGLAALAGRKRVARNIGEAAKKGVLPLDHPAFSEIRDLLGLVTRLEP